MGGPMGMGPMGKWWKNSQMVQKLGLNDAQVQQIEKIFQDHRLQLIDLQANLQKQEAILQPLVEADRPDESQVSTQIDKVAQARANLEKSHALMLLAIRKVLTVDQWKTLEAQHGPGMMHEGRGRDGNGAPPPPSGQ
jgi:Spy/CpxP family protein refolding chaperone